MRRAGIVAVRPCRGPGPGGGAGGGASEFLRELSAFAISEPRGPPALAEPQTQPFPSPPPIQGRHFRENRHKTLIPSLLLKL